jgi:hypothetical protein
VVYQAGQERRRDFVKLFDKLSYSKGGWRIWQDFIYLSAAALSQPCDHRKEREDEYLRIINSYNKDEQNSLAEMFAVIVQAFEEEKHADILGDLYMQLDMGNKGHGQFFTPFHICHMMAKVTYSGESLQSEIEKKGYISVSDPCCGGGALLIAFAKYCIEEDVNYQQHIIFSAQDIDPTCAKMCYIQMSLLGMPGYVTIGNSITQPTGGHPLFPQRTKLRPDMPDTDVWFTPLWFADIWHYRRLWYGFDEVLKSAPADEPPDVPADEPPMTAEPPPKPPVKEVESPTITLSYEQMSLF